MATNNSNNGAAGNAPEEFVSLQEFTSPVDPPDWEAEKRQRLGRPAISPNYPEGLPDFDDTANENQPRS
jgi:hypothetical protein